MSEAEFTTVMNLPLNQINLRRHRRLLLEYAGELAAPCVAEALMEKLKPRKKGIK
ncbi:hypothetical protein QCD61_28245 (plasmid) [Pseudomonas viciae]|uniref:Uncharacterized protein n=1 Tax=Pseudomonas viciae TaxID=2505979 RepID=A0ABY8PMK4_9PSED|nr:hypothetical protein [Pseudomonas viciae]WGO96455.1 hypothetical protein QCD61_28245 [Pseudomonas viciae]